MFHQELEKPELARLEQKRLSGPRDVVAETIELKDA
jgi:hypothetical protein